MDFYRRAARADLGMCSFHIQALFDGNRWQEEQTKPVAPARRISLTRSETRRKNPLISLFSGSLCSPARYAGCTRKYVSSREALVYPRLLFRFPSPSFPTFMSNSPLAADSPVIGKFVRASPKSATPRTRKSILVY